MAKDALEVANAFHYLRIPELNALKKYAEKVCKLAGKDRPVIVNIGAGAGTSGMALREGCGRSELYTIDISPTGPLGGLEGERNAFANSGLKIPIQILSDSAFYGREKWDKTNLCHLVFVDGCHLYKAVIDDINAWKDHVIVGGYFIFHDYNHDRWNRVIDAIDETIKRSPAWKMLELVQTTMVFEKLEEDEEHYGYKEKREKSAQRRN